MNTPLEIIGHDPEHCGITDDKGRPYPAFIARGCGCCSTQVRVTQENIDAAISQAEQWLAVLREMKPVDYPADVEGGMP